MWIFGYGSLIWKTDFPYEKKCYGYINGYVRRFWQSSEDHRGIPGQPGRVVTLIPSDDPEARVWGIAYKINDEDVKFVSSHLDYREKDGYEKVTLTFYPVEGPTHNKKETDGVPEILNLPQPFQLSVYIGTEHNNFFAGEAAVPEIAKQILAAEGPSGTNREYLFRLAESTRILFPDYKDDHLFSLETAVLEMARENYDVNITH